LLKFNTNKYESGLHVSLQFTDGGKSMFSRPKRIEPKVGQESVWDYPRPPRLEESDRHVQVVFNGVVVADSRRAKRILETASPPTYYIPFADVKMTYLTDVGIKSWCEWKGKAMYHSLSVNGKVSEDCAWSYPEPTMGYAGIFQHIAFYPARVDYCTVAGEIVRPQGGSFYGGWVTDEIVGPWKGEAGTGGW
jgi:uncharacterized protein (DUF427 family)